MRLSKTDCIFEISIKKSRLIKKEKSIKNKYI